MERKYIKNPLTGRYILAGGKTHLRIKKDQISCSHRKFPRISPPFKWAGGKSRLIDKLLELMPNKINTYYEPFLGSGVVFLNVVNTIHPRKVVINDINDSLILLYSVIISRTMLTKFENQCKKLGKIYAGLSIQKRKEFYSLVRDKFNKLKKHHGKIIERSVLFYFLIKTMFNGMYRENKSGECTQFISDRWKIMMDCDIDKIEEIHKLLKSVKMEMYSKYFSDTLKNTTKGDFVYLDPPYIPTDIEIFGDLSKDIFKTSKQKPFVGYNKQSFDNEDHMNVIKAFIELDKKNVKVMLSNSYNTKYINFFRRKGFNIHPVKVNRLISVKSARYTNKFNEVIITNY